MKILILQDDFPPEASGGAGIVAYTLAIEYQRQGHEVLVATATQKRENIGKSIFEGLAVDRIYSRYHERWRAYRSLYNPLTIPSLKKILSEFQPDVVHAHNLHQHLSYYALVLARRTTKKVFLTAHDTMLFDYGKSMDARPASMFLLARTFRFRYNPLRNFFIRRSLRSVRNIIAVSEALHVALIHNGISPVDVIYNGIDVAAWEKVDAFAIAAFREKYGLLHQKVVLFGGRVSPLKGSDALLAALPRIIEHVPNALLLVVGKENEFALYLRDRLAGLGGHVACTGWLSGEELKAAYAASDVVAVPSLYLEPFGMIALEAMAAGKPVVGTCCGALPEIIVDSETGYIVDPNNTVQLSAAIAALLSSDELAKRMGEAGRLRAKNFFSVRRQAERYIVLFENNR
jgi:glycosyltransferase involved in cell wall biosynthesis